MCVSTPRPTGEENTRYVGLCTDEWTQSGLGYVMALVKWTMTNSQISQDILMTSVGHNVNSYGGYGPNSCFTYSDGCVGVVDNCWDIDEQLMYHTILNYIGWGEVEKEVVSVGGSKAVALGEAIVGNDVTVVVPS